ncbi:MAG: DUF167 family protein [Parvibaculaceae bacterium]
MSLHPFKPDERGVLLFIRVTPGAARPGIAGLRAGADGRPSLQLKVRAPPEKGRANEAAIELLAGALDLPKRAFAIVAGAGDRLKTVRIAGDPATLSSKLTTLIQDRSP